MKKKIQIQKVSTWSMAVTVMLAILFGFLSLEGEKEFHILENTTEQYISCENAAKQLQDGSDYLTEQVRLYAMTGKKEYRDLYFEEADVTRRREKALENLKQYFDGTEAFQSLQSALELSQKLMNTEYYSMKLVAEAQKEAEEELPEELQNTTLVESDRKLSEDEKMLRAQQLVCDSKYQDARVSISSNVSDCMNSLIEKTRNRQRRASTIFSDMYLKLEIAIVILVVLIFAICIMVRRIIVKPLNSYNESIRKNELLPVTGAAELQNLAETYNKVFQENEEIQKLIRHQAEHDALTEALNRGSFEKILQVYDTEDSNFALILIDVDSFKSVNDTYGHAAGDEILKKVTTLLKKAFRSIDYVCRIGGDEFAIIMVEMTSDLRYTIEEKIEEVNAELAKADEGLPAVSLSVGVAFADRENPGENIFKDADKALYHVKENGKSGCWFYEMKNQ